jgi:hypothetical protein
MTAPTTVSVEPEAYKANTPQDKQTKIINNMKDKGKGLKVACRMMPEPINNHNTRRTMTIRKLFSISFSSAGLSG